MKSKKNRKKEISVPFLAFTFFYAVSIYTMLVGYLYWKENKELEEVGEVLDEEEE